MEEKETTDRILILGAAAKEMTKALEKYPLFNDVRMVVVTVCPDGSPLGDVMNIVTSLTAEETENALEHAQRFVQRHKPKPFGRAN